MASSGVCSTCKGTGTRTGRVGTTSKCAVCHGNGVCNVCKGTGIHRDKDCPFCLHSAPEKPTLAETQGKEE